MVAFRFLRILLLVGSTSILPEIAFSQYAEIEAKMERLFNSISNGNEVHIVDTGKVITILQRQASYKIPYTKVSCTYFVDSIKMGTGTRIHSVRVQCLAKSQGRGCYFKVRFADGWRGVSAEAITFNTSEDAHEFVELMARIKEKRPHLLPK